MTQLLTPTGAAGHTFPDAAQCIEVAQRPVAGRVACAGTGLSTALCANIGSHRGITPKFRSAWVLRHYWPAFCGKLSLYDSIVRGAASSSSPYRAIAPGDFLIRFHTRLERTPAAVLAGFLFVPL
jgi:hypothetical protein